MGGADGANDPQRGQQPNAPPTADDLWEAVKERAKKYLPEQAYVTWIEPWRALRLTEDALHLAAPSGFHREWLEQHYADLLSDIAAELMGRPVHIRPTTSHDAFPDVAGPQLAPATKRDTSATTAPSHAHEPPTARKPVIQKAQQLAQLNDRYTFDRLVVGSNNQLAVAAAKAVADKPAISYNPLFLYGGVGLGKTHLMHAVGHQVIGSSAGAKVIRYISCERFVNEVITSIQKGTMSELRQRYRSIDLLLVDDVHFLAGKDRTQEEFFHTFNALYDAYRQIVLTSDRAPQEIKSLEDRLVSRFEMGLVVDVKPPDYETRMAILRQKASEDGLTLDDDVIGYIAESCTASVRHLEGAVIKLLALSSLTHQDIDLPLARSALGKQRQVNRDEPRGPVPAPEGISRFVAECWGVSHSDMVSSSRKRDVATSRQVAMYLIKEITGISLARVGGYFGNRDHSTVIHSLRKVEERMATDHAFRSQVLKAYDELSTNVNI